MERRRCDMAEIDTVSGRGEENRKRWYTVVRG